MNAKTLTGAVVGLAVVIILVATLFMPVYSEYTTAEKTYTNEGMPYAAVDDDTHTIVVTEDAITVDDEEIDQSLFPSSTSISIVYADAGFIRLVTNSVAVNATSSGSSKSYSYDGYTVTITIAGSTATVSTTEGSTTSTVSDVIYYVANEGEYVLATNPCVTSESVMYGAGQTSFTTPNTMVSLVWSGTTEGMTATSLYTTNGSSVVDSVEVNTTTVNGNLVRIDSVLINITNTYGGTDYENTATYTYFLAPAEVTYSCEEYLGDGNAAILSALPVLLIAGIVIASVAFFATGRRD